MQSGLFFLGIWLVGNCRTLPSLKYCVALLVVLILIYFFSQMKWIKIILLHLIFFAIGFCWQNFHAQQWLAKRLPVQLAQKNIAVTGTIISLPIEEKIMSRFLLQTEYFNGKNEKRRLQLSWQNPHPILHVGEKWQITVRLKPPHGLNNFGVPNHLNYYWTHIIHATGFVVSKAEFKKLSDYDFFFAVAHWRQQLQDDIRKTIHDPTVAAILSALTVGIEDGLSAEDWQILQRTGTVHLVVVAGLHIGLMVSIIYFAINYGWRFLPWLILRFPAQRAASYGALIFSWLYGSLAGFGIPTQRAVIMQILMIIHQLTYRQINIWRRIMLAFWVVILIQPGAIWSASLWLSFAAIISIALYTNMDGDKVAHWRQWPKIQLALFMGVTPLTIYFFQQFSMVGLFANLPAILWIGWVILPLCLFAAGMNLVSQTISHTLLNLAGYLLLPLWHFLQWLAHWDWSAWKIAMPRPWVLWLSLFGVILFLATKKYYWRTLGVLGFLMIWLIHSPKPPLGSYWVTVLDVGQGLAITVQTARHFLIYDTGLRIPDGFDTGRDVIGPYLVHLGIHKIDTIVISHRDSDHSGGAHWLIKQWPFQQFLTSFPALFADAHAENCVSGQGWNWDGVPFKILGPAVNQSYQGNNSSCILQIGTAGRQTLLTGDIESMAEFKLIQEQGQALNSAIMSVPHHGSKTSSTLSFLQTVQPQYAVFSLGYLNRFHFPAPSVEKHYHQLGISILRTDQDGAILFKVPSTGLSIFESANKHQYFWENRRE